MARAHSFVITVSNNKTEREGIDCLTERAAGFHRTHIGMGERCERSISLLHVAVFARTFELSISAQFDFGGES